MILLWRHVQYSIVSVSRRPSASFAAVNIQDKRPSSTFQDACYNLVHQLRALHSHSLIPRCVRGLVDSSQSTLSLVESTQHWLRTPRPEWGCGDRMKWDTLPVLWANGIGGIRIDENARARKCGWGWSRMLHRGCYNEWCSRQLLYVRARGIALRTPTPHPTKLSDLSTPIN
jgi:hypothetical protein